LVRTVQQDQGTNVRFELLAVGIAIAIASELVVECAHGRRGLIVDWFVDSWSVDGWTCAVSRQVCMLVRYTVL
jgi:hypothetical protein